MTRKMRSSWALTSALLVSTGVWAEGQSSSLLADTCAGCHGTNGSSVGPASPTIAGMSVETFLEAMKGYRTGTRPSTIMDRLTKGYTEEQIKEMAEYFSKQKFERFPQEVDAAKVKAGKKLADEHCERCHEDGGRKDEDGSGVLAGQWLPYLRFSMEDFQSGAREMPKKMKKAIESMVGEAGPGSIESVVQYYAGQK